MSETSPPLFRREVYLARRERLLGEVVLPHTLSDWAVVGFLLLLIAGTAAWAAITPYDRIERAGGSVIAARPPINVRAPRAGVVEVIVRDGQRVSRGDALAAVRLEDSDRGIVRAPADGRVAGVQVRPGYLVEAHVPMLALLPAGAPGLVEVAVSTTQASRVRRGQVAFLTPENGPADARLRGTVESISALPLRRDEFHFPPRRDRAYRAVIRLDRTNGSAPALGTPVTAAIVVSRSTVLGLLIERIQV